MSLLRFLPPAVAALVLLAAMGLTSRLAPLPAPARTLAAICIVLSALVAAFVSRPEIRSRASVALALAGATAAGQALIGPAYAALGALLALACTLSMRAPRAAPSRDAGTVRLAPVLVMLGTSGAVFALFAGGLPPLSVQVERYFMGRLGSSRHAMGFSSTLRLGEMRGMLDSNRPVLEVDGVPVDYLRGAVLDDFDRHTWRASDRLRAGGSADAILPRPQGTTRISFVPGARLLRDERARFFLPAPSCDYGTASGRLALDSGGIGYPNGTGDESIWFRTASCESPAWLRPEVQDITVPSHEVTKLQELSRAWTRGATSDHDKLVALQRELMTFRYSLEPQDMYWADDPILDFLLVQKKGYCEQFASAMVLLARAEGIPARIVTGYRVPPPGALSGRMIVRERNAHAWMEAWVGGQWHAYDATPLSESIGAQERLEDFGEWVSMQLDRAWEAIGRISVVDTTLLLGALVLAFFLVRRYRGRLRRRRGPGGVDAPSLACFDGLSLALEKGGLARSPSEPLERFARRLRERDEPWARDVAEALARYAALRYGGIGDEREVAAAVDAAARRVRPTS